MKRFGSYRFAIMGLVVLFATAAAMLGSDDRARGLSQVLGVQMPQGMEARSTALFLTGPDGWTSEHATRAGRLTELHTMVIAIDGPGLLDLVDGDCAALGTVLVDLARQVQAREGALARTPVLTALADAGDLALHAARDGPARFKGMVTEGFGSRPGLCGGAHIPETMGQKAPVRWLDIPVSGHSSPAATLAGTKIVDPAEAGPRKAFYRSYLGVAGTDSSFDVTTGGGVAALDDLPLTIHEVTTAPETEVYAIFLSGDGGWARFSEEISTRLAAQGVPVVGISSLRYLWQEKPPAVIARDIARIDAQYRESFGRDRVLLLGFSLGANAVPFAAAELPAELKARLAGIGLIAPETLTGFEIVVGGWLGAQTGAVPVAPAIDALDRTVPGVRVACLHGSTETVSACPAAAMPGMQRVVFQGGHHLGHAHDRIQDILAELIK